MKTTVIEKTVEATVGVKVSASTLAFDVEQCPRCFYLKARTGLEKPSGPVAAIFSKLEKMTREIIGERSLSDVFEGAPDGVIEKSNVRMTSDPVLFPELNVQVEVSCQADTLVRLADGSRAIVMFKTGDPSKNLEAYTRQLHACAFALKNCNKPERRIEDVSTLGIMMFDPIKYSQGAPVDEFCKWFPVAYEPESFDCYLEKVAQIAASDEVPNFTDGCGFCERDKGILARYGIEVNP